MPQPATLTTPTPFAIDAADSPLAKALDGLDCVDLSAPQLAAVLALMDAVQHPDHQGDAADLLSQAQFRCRVLERMIG